MTAPTPPAGMDRDRYTDLVEAAATALALAADDLSFAPYAVDSPARMQRREAYRRSARYALDAVLPYLLPAAPSGEQPTPSELVDEYGVRYRWRDGTVEDALRPNRRWAEQTVAARAGDEYVTASLIHRQQITTPWTEVQPTPEPAGEVDRG